MTAPTTPKSREPWLPLVAVPADSIPAKRARIYWNQTDGAEKVCDVLVNAEPSAGRAYGYSGGAAYSDWLNPEKGAKDGFHQAADFTPEGQFGAWVAQGFADEHVA